MTVTVVEVGPAAVRGPAGSAAAAAALEHIDDDIALLDERPVPVADLWRDVLLTATGSRRGPAVVVCPSWWSARRIARIRDAARAVAPQAVVLARAGVLATGGISAVVEIAGEMVVVTTGGAIDAAIPRVGDTADADTGIAAAVADTIGAARTVLLDAPPGVPGGARLAAALAERLTTAGVAVTIAEPGLVTRRAALASSGAERPPVSPPRRRRPAFLAAGSVLCAAAVCGALATLPAGAPQAVDTPMTLLVEGRVGVRIPAAWMVQRITAGPGSARLQVVSPGDPHTAVLVVQSPVPLRQPLPEAARVLRDLLDEQPPGVFADFRPADNRAGRDVVTYRETRPGHDIGWAVLIDGAVRIGIGCQSPRGREHDVLAVCDEAVRSAHAVF